VTHTFKLEVKVSEKNPQYVPGYSDEDISEMSNTANVSGKSPKNNVAIEEAAQKAAAENPVWQIAREVNWRRYMDSNDSRIGLEALGFTIQNESKLFYGVNPPVGWTKETLGFWTTVRDTEGKERLTQFYKGAWYDTSAFVNFTE